MKYFDVDVNFVKGGESIITLDYSNCRIDNYQVETLDSNEYESYFKEIGFAIVDKIDFVCSGLTSNNDSTITKNNSFILNKLKEVSISVVPSKWDEPFGRSSLEAASRGSALIISNSGGLKETTKDALVIENITEGILYKKIKFLIDNKNYRKKLQKRAYKNFIYTNKYSSNMIDTLRSLLITKKSISYNLIGVWTQLVGKGTKDHVNYIRQFKLSMKTYDSFIKTNNTIIIGDFNSNLIWEKPKKRIDSDHKYVVEELQKKNNNLNITNLNADLAKVNLDSTSITKNKEWLKNLNKDIYLSEAVQIIRDIK